MKFSNAVLLLSEGKKIRRKQWEAKSWIGRMGFNMHPLLNLDDWNADDWELLEDTYGLNLFIEAFEECLAKPELIRRIKSIIGNP